MFRGPWPEARTHRVKLNQDNVPARDFLRLLDVLQMGAAHPDMSGALKDRPAGHLADHVRTYRLADRFQTREAQRWVKTALDGWMVWLIHNWKPEVARMAEIMAATGQVAPPAFNAIEQARVLDFSDAWCILQNLEAHQRAIQPSALITTLLEACPRQLLRDNLERMDRRFVVCVCARLLA